MSVLAAHGCDFLTAATGWQFEVPISTVLYAEYDPPNQRLQVQVVPSGINLPRGVAYDFTTRVQTDSMLIRIWVTAKGTFRRYSDLSTVTIDISGLAPGKYTLVDGLTSKELVTIDTNTRFVGPSHAMLLTVMYGDKGARQSRF